MKRLVSGTLALKFIHKFVIGIQCLASPPSDPVRHMCTNLHMGKMSA